MSKLYLTLLPLLFAAHSGSAQTPQQIVRPPLTHVTVYLNGTGLEHRGKVTLAAGLNRLIVNNLSSRMKEETLEVSLGDEVELLSVSDDDDEAKAPPPAPLNQSAADSLTRAEAELRTIEGELQGLQQEKTFLLANQVLPAGTQANWSAEVQKGATLMRTRLPVIQQETDRLQSRKQVLSGQVHDLGPRAKETTYGDWQVLLVRASRAVTVPLVMRYYVRSRMPWWPTLDIRADATGRELEFVTHGRIRNQSGLPWQQVHLVLMRHLQSDDLSRPDLEPWALDFNGGDHVGEGRIDQFVVKGTAKGKQVEVSQGTRYEVPELVSLAWNKTRELTLPSAKLTGRPEYLSVPRVSEHVFLQTKVSGWEGLQLPEEARVYHQGVYVGDTELNERAYNDSLEVALGHDELLVVGRAKLEDFSGNVPLSDKRRVRLSYELNVRNRHPEAVRLRLLDQIPVSEEKEISVKVLETSGAALDARSGKLTWLLALASGENKRVRFTFQVDYPKDKQVEIINHQVRISNPKFR